MPCTPKVGLIAALAALLLARVAGAQSQVDPGQGPLPVFEFHSGFWVNLHHFLYQQARLRQRVADANGPGEKNDAAGMRMAATAIVATEALTPEEQSAWAAAVGYYRKDLAGRDLLFNGDMVEINNRLAELETCADLAGRRSRECASGLRPELVTALEDAAPVYRARWWPEHDRANRAWIAAVGPLVRQLGGELARQLSAAYRHHWPAERLRVDAVMYSGLFGAYTTLDPVHVTISSSDARNQGAGALEVLLHEASHALTGAIRDAIARECRTRGKPIPRDLWHALLFYTTGEIVRRALDTPESSSGRAAEASAKPASKGYTPYAYRHGLYSRGWQNYQRVLEQYWQPYLEGRVEFATAVARIVSNL